MPLVTGSINTDGSAWLFDKSGGIGTTDVATIGYYMYVLTTVGYMPWGTTSQMMYVANTNRVYIDPVR